MRRSVQNDTRLITALTTELNEAYIAEEAYWKQRSRLLWLSLGDRNTEYFHAITKGRKRANAFTVLEDSDGNIVYKEEDIGKSIVKYFQELFSSTDTPNAETVIYALRPVISEEDNQSLISIPSAAEIREATFSIHADKAPGPDGFSASFYQTNWEAIGPEIVMEVQGVLRSGVLPRTSTPHI